MGALYVSVVTSSVLLYVAPELVKITVCAKETLIVPVKSKNAAHKAPAFLKKLLRGAKVPVGNATKQGRTHLKCIRCSLWLKTDFEAPRLFRAFKYWNRCVIGSTCARKKPVFCIAKYWLTRGCKANIHYQLVQPPPCEGLIRYYYDNGICNEARKSEAKVAAILYILLF